MNTWSKKQEKINQILNLEGFITAEKEGKYKKVVAPDMTLIVDATKEPQPGEKIPIYFLNQKLETIEEEFDNWLDKTTKAVNMAMSLVHEEPEQEPEPEPEQEPEPEEIKTTTWNKIKKKIEEELTEKNFSETNIQGRWKKKINKELTQIVDLRREPKPSENIYSFFVDKNLEIITTDFSSNLEAIDSIIRKIRNEQPEQTKKTEMDFTAELSIETIQQYINPAATREEAYRFMQLCLAQKLNPFIGEAHLIKDKPGATAKFVVGKDAHLRKAEEQATFNGFESGIIVETDGKENEKVGAFYTKKEILLGGWAKVYRKDIDKPFISKVTLEEYIGLRADGTPNKQWKRMPATMIQKVALVQALRSSYAGILGGLYDPAEIDV
jgi:phage recombination protein Bet